MRRLSISYIAGIALLGAGIVSSCEIRETETMDNPKETVLTASIESGTKTSLSPNGDGTYKVLWSEGDEIAVFIDGSQFFNLFQLTGGEGTKQGSFSGYGEGDHYVAVYPSSNAGELNGNTISLTIPDEQNYSHDSFGQGDYPMIAEASSSSLQFRNLSSLLKLSIKGHHTITTIEFTSADPTCIVSGPATVETGFGSSPVLKMDPSGSPTVILNTGGVAVKEDEATDFYIALPPQTYKGGFSVKVNTSTGYMVKTYSADFTMERAMVHESTPFTIKLDEGIEPSTYLEGNGTEGDPFLIRNLEDLLYMQASVNTTDGTIKSADGAEVPASSAYYSLLNSIDLSPICSEELGQSWDPIGDYGTDENWIFTGTFKGNGNTIRNLYIDSDKAYRGFFGKARSNDWPYKGSIESLVVKGTVRGTNNRIALVAGDAYRVSNCYSYGSVENTSGRSYVAGIVAAGYIVSECINYASISGGSDLGGITGSSSYIVSGCVNEGPISSTGSYVGGIIGYTNAGYLFNCRNSADITASGYLVGGITGYNRQGSKVDNCINTGNVFSGYGKVGGISGECNTWSDPADTAIRNCVNTGEVTITGTNPNYSDNIGGIVGLSNSIVSNCYWLYDESAGKGLENGIGQDDGTSSDLFSLTEAQIKGEDYGQLLYSSANGLIFTHLLGALNGWAYDNRSDQPYWGWRYPTSNSYPDYTGIAATEPTDGDGLIVITPSSQEVTAAGGEIIFDVLSSREYHVSSLPSWIHEGDSEEVQGVNNTYKHHFNVDMYSGSEERTGTIAFCDDEGVCASATVIQKTLGTDPAIELSALSISVLSSGGEKVLNVTSNVAWTISSDQSWCTVNPTSGSGGDTAVNITVPKNTGSSTRIAHLTIKSSDGSISKTVNVAQSSKKDFNADEWKDRNFYHRSLFMRFTATWCGWCPRMNNAIKLAQKKYPEKLIYVALHNSDSDLAFSGTLSLRSKYNVNSFPTGLVDGRIKLSNQDMEIVSEQIIAASKETEENYGTATGIALSSTVTGREVNVDVDAYVKQKGNYKITVLLMEDGIIAPQTDYEGTTSATYNHSNIARISLSSITGDDFSVSEDYSVQSFAYSASVPEEYNISNMKVLVYIQTEYGSRTIIRSANYGTFFVDNCVAVKVGEKLELESEQNSSGGNEGILPGDDIDM